MQNNQDALRKAIRMANTSEGRQLIALLQNQDPARIRQAAASASAGDFDQAKQALSGLMSIPEIRALLEQMGGNHGSDGR